MGEVYKIHLADVRSAVFERRLCGNEADMGRL